MLPKKASSKKVPQHHDSKMKGSPFFCIGGFLVGFDCVTVGAAVREAPLCLG